MQAEREGYTMKETTIIKTNSAADYIGYAFSAFGGLGMEVLLLILEATLYKQASGAWSDLQVIIHWLATSCIWGCFGVILMKKLPAAPGNNLQKKNLILAAIISSISILYTSLVWQGFKPAIEFSNLDAGKFLFQYIYYALESLLIVLIIAHGQKAFETKFGTSKSIPFGGIFLAATWGLVHIFTQGGSTGIDSVIQSMLFGTAYLVLTKNYKISYIAIALMFML